MPSLQSPQGPHPALPCVHDLWATYVITESHKQIVWLPSTSWAGPGRQGNSNESRPSPVAMGDNSQPCLAPYGRKPAGKRPGLTWAECVQGRGLPTWPKDGHGEGLPRGGCLCGQLWDITWPLRRGFPEADWGKGTCYKRKPRPPASWGPFSFPGLLHLLRCGTPPLPG